MPTTNRMLFLESLRGAAALLVAIFHFSIPSYISSSMFVNNGWLMVDVFFVISGFVIAYNYQFKINDLKDLCTFQARRFLRLYPLHIALLIVFVIIETLKYFAEQKLGAASSTPAFSANNISSLAHNILFTQGIFLENLTWNYPSWSVSVEFYTYIIFGAATLAAPHSRKPAFIVLISLVFVTGSGFYLLFHDMTTQNGLMRCLFAFFLGVITLNIWLRLRSTFNAWLGGLTLAFVIYLLSTINFQTIEPTGLIIPVLFSVALLFLANAPADSPLLRALSQKWLVYLGTISYGIYMIHSAVWWVLNQALRFVFNFEIQTNDSGNYTILIENEFIALTLLFAGLATIVCIAHYSYKYLEIPMNNLRHSMKL